MQVFLTISGILAIVMGVFAMWIGLSATDIQLLLGAILAVAGVGLIGLGSVIARMT